MSARIHINAYRGIGVNSEGTNYPFVQPSDDIKYLLADLWLSHKVSDVQLPLRVSWVYGLDKAFDDTCDFTNENDTGSSVSVSEGSSSAYEPTHDVDIIIVDAADTVIFDSRYAVTYTTDEYLDRMRIHEWRMAGAACKIIQHAAFPNTAAIYTVPEEIEPENGVLEGLCSQCVPPFVEGIRVGLTRLTGDVILRNGFNTTLEPDEVIQDGLRRVQRVVISAVPGSGMGRSTDCDPENIYIRRINNVQGTARGDFKLVAQDCYHIRRTGTYDEEGAFTPTPARLMFGNDCKPCCECDDYLNTYAGLVRIHERFKALAVQLEAARDLYHDNRRRWRLQKECRESNPIRLSTAVFERQYVEVSMAICNQTPECLRRLKVYIEVGPDQCPADEDNKRRTYVVSCATFKTDTDNALVPWSFSGLGEGGKIQGTLSATWDALQPSSSARLRFRLQILGSEGEVKPEYLEDCQFYVNVVATVKDRVYGTPVQKYFNIGDC